MAELMLAALAALAGGVGAVVRFVIDSALTARVARRQRGSAFPRGILIVNLTGSLLIGVLAGVAADSEPVMLVLGAGLLGGYTTFSTASYDTIQLLRRGRIAAGFANGFGQLVVAVLTAWLGFALGSLIAG